MLDDITRLARIAAKPERHILGLMSGTSLDGLDIALCRVEGAGEATCLTVENFTTVPYTAAFRDRVGEVFARRSIDLERLCLLNPFVAQVHSDMNLAEIDDGHRPAWTIDLSRKGGRRRGSRSVSTGVS